MMHMTKAMFKRSAATVGLIPLLWLLSTLTIPPSSHAAIFFDTDFENCAVGTGNDFPCEGWDDQGQEQLRAMEVVSGGAFSGSKFLRHFSNGQNGSTDGTSATLGNTFKPSIYHSGMPRDHVFLRFAIRISSGAQICDNGHTKLIRLRPEQNNAAYPVVWTYWRYGSYQLLTEGPARSFNTGITPNYGQWDQIEVEVKWNTPGSANGLLRMWVNGVLRIEAPNLTLRGSTPTSSCGVGSDKICPSQAEMDFAQVYNQCMMGTIDYDRIAISNTRMGPTNPKQTSTDSIPPASPQGFQVH